VEGKPAREVSVALDRVGGRLVLELGDSQTPAFLFHGGFYESVEFLRMTWLPLQEPVVPAAGEIVIPEMEAGKYTLCLADPQSLSALILMKSIGTCTKGELLPTGELRLKIEPKSAVN
jgi:hypothetical protein